MLSSDANHPLYNRPTNMPLPNQNPVEVGIWQAAAKGKLVLQKCSECGLHRYPVSVGCPHCGALDWRWDEITDTGSVISFSWLQDYGRKNETNWPSSWYNVAIVKLHGANIPNAHMVTNIVNAWHPGELSVGQTVRLRPVPLTAEIGLPCFELVQV